MSLKRSSAGASRSTGGSDGAKVGRQELFDQLKKLFGGNQTFTPVDIALSTGAGEPQVAKTLLGLAAEGVLEKVDGGKYRVVGGFADIGMGEFLKSFSRATRSDSNRSRDLLDINRLKQNNDIMRAKLLQAIAERDHYKAALERHGIDAGPPPVVSAPVTGGAPPGAASAEPEPSDDESPPSAPPSEVS